MGLIFKDSDNKPIDPKAARTRAILLSLPFAFMGVFALVLLAHDGLLGGLDREHAMGLLSAAIVCGGLIALIFGITAKKEALKAGAAKAGDEKPWLKRKEWADGRIITSARKAILLLWIFVAFWCAASGAISFVVVLPQLHQGHNAALIALIFPLIGLGMIYFVVKTTRAWRKFGQAIFAMPAVPAASGGALAGEIQVKTGMQPQHGWHLRLSCVRRTTTGASNNRRTTEKILWQDEKWLRADLPQAGPNTTALPVFFKLPGNLPESEAAPGDGIHWKLEASAELRGPDFHAAFDVPVFKLEAMPVVSDDPTLQYLISLDEVRRQIRSQIQVRDLADGGSEFIFPAARNRSFTSGATIVWLIWTGIIGLLLWNRAPLPLLAVSGAIDLLMTAFVFDLWFRRSRVVVNPKGLTVQRAWFAFQQEQCLKTSEIKSIASDVGATAGHAVYHDLKAQARDGKEFLLAKNVDSKPEADWLVQRMIAALKPPA